jgi:hypothetical protein
VTRIMKEELVKEEDSTGVGGQLGGEHLRRRAVKEKECKGGGQLRGKDSKEEENKGGGQ